MHRPDDDFAKKISRFAALSFVRVDATTGAVSYWNVEPSGDYAADCAAGRELAVATISFIASEDSPHILAHVLRAMPRDHSGLEVGFILALTLMAVEQIANAMPARAARIAQSSAAATG